MQTKLARRLGLPSLFLAGALFGSAITGAAVASQPHMQAALTALNNARTALQAAEADKGGHRDNALDLVNKAIAQVQAGIAYANAHK